MLVGFAVGRFSAFGFDFRFGWVFSGCFVCWALGISWVCTGFLWFPDCGGVGVIPVLVVCECDFWVLLIRCGVVVLGFNLVFTQVLFVRLILGVSELV